MNTNFENQRGFQVIVPRERASALVYQVQPAEKTIETMTELQSRGFSPIARTTANGITEDLTLAEMNEIYAY